MNNEPVAWIIESDEEIKNGKNFPTLDWYGKDILNLPIGTKLYTQYQLEEARKLGMQQERAMWELAASTQEIMDTHPAKDREKDRLRFSDEAFNRWLDEGISDSGHTVYDLVENVCEAWHGWENSQYYTHPVKEQLTDEEILEIASPMFEDARYPSTALDFARAILRKASEK